MDSLTRKKARKRSRWFSLVRVGFASASPRRYHYSLWRLRLQEAWQLREGKGLSLKGREDMSQITVTDAGMRIVEFLVGNPPKTMADLIKDSGVTRTAVTEQLIELLAAGLVARSVERTPGRGRPRHRYEATGAAMLFLFADNQRLVVPALWKAIHEVGGEQFTKKVLKRVGKSVAEHYKSRVKGRTPRARLRQLVELLRKEGGLLAVESDGIGGLRIHKRSCPFFCMYEEMESVCTVDREMMSLVVGAKVKRIACRHDGDPCCTFELARKGGR